MKILTVSDLHDYTDNIKNVVGISDASCVIIAGDLTCWGDRYRAQKIIEYIKGYNANVYAIAGNLDSKEVEDFLIDAGISLHGTGFIIGDIGIFGVGGSNPTPFNTANEIEESEIEYYIYQGFKMVKDAPFKLLITHAPPYNTMIDILYRGRHVGSKKIREFIELYQPNVCVSGHIHESRGIDRIGQTMIINPGMLRHGGYVEIIKDSSGLKTSLKFIAMEK